MNKKKGKERKKKNKIKKRALNNKIEHVQQPASRLPIEERIWAFVASRERTPSHTDSTTHRSAPAWTRCVGWRAMSIDGPTLQPSPDRRAPRYATSRRATPHTTRHDTLDYETIWSLRTGARRLTRGAQREGDICAIKIKMKKVMARQLYLSQTRLPFGISTKKFFSFRILRAFPRMPHESKFFICCFSAEKENERESGGK